MKKLSLSLLVCFFATASVFAQTAEELIQKNIEARGGEASIRAIESIKQMGEGQVMGMTVPFTVYMVRPHLMRNEVSVQGQNIVTAYDGETAWTINPMTGSTEAQKLPAAQATQIERQADIDGALLDYADKGYTITYEGEAEVRGEPAYKLKVTDPEGEVTHQFVDAASYLVVKTEQQTNNPMMGGEVTVETFMGDHQEVEGVMLPFSIETVMNGQSFQTLTLDSIEVNSDIDPALFAYPSGE